MGRPGLWYPHEYELEWVAGSSQWQHLVFWTPAQYRCSYPLLYIHPGSSWWPNYFCGFLEHSERSPVGLTECDMCFNFFMLNFTNVSSSGICMRKSRYKRGKYFCATYPSSSQVPGWCAAYIISNFWNWKMAAHSPGDHRDWESPIWHP